jgi:hypothetical protein
MPEWFDSWLLDARTQNMLGLASLVATVLLGAAAIWVPVRRLIEETLLLTGALLVNLVALGVMALLCVGGAWLLVLPAPYVGLKLLVSAALLCWALRPGARAGRLLGARDVALIAALSWAVVAVALSQGEAERQRQPTLLATPTPPLSVPTPLPTVSGYLIDSAGNRLPTVTPEGK